MKQLSITRFLSFPFVAPALAPAAARLPELMHREIVLPANELAAVRGTQ
jgi:hypothetical protein